MVVVEVVVAAAVVFSCKSFLPTYKPYSFAGYNLKIGLTCTLVERFLKLTIHASNAIT